MAASPLPIQTPERVTWTCPLGLRFFDVATGRYVIDGLSVEATAASGFSSTVKSVLTPSGVHAFHRLPGLPSMDHIDQMDPWDPPPSTREYRIRVVDTMNRFIPVTFVIAAPFKGLEFPPILGSPPYSDERGIPLFSAPTRLAPPGYVSVRARLQQLATANPAAYATIEIAYASAGRTAFARGMADQAGQLLAFFPMPEGPRRGFGGSPPSGARVPEWPGTFSFFHDSGAPADEYADYALRLSQPPASAYRDGSPGLLFTEAVLTYGEENNLGDLDLAAF